MLDIDRGAPGALAAIRRETRAAMEEDGAKAILLGCAGVATLSSELSVEFGCPVMEGIAAGVGPAAALAPDDAVTGPDRGAFLRDWPTGAETRRARALVRDGRLAGFGAARDCVEGVKISPLIAPDRAAAGAMIDMPEPNAQTLAMARARGLSPVFVTARMGRGPTPAQDLAPSFGVATLELGGAQGERDDRRPAGGGPPHRGGLSGTRDAPGSGGGARVSLGRREDHLHGRAALCRAAGHGGLQRQALQVGEEAHPAR